MATTISDNYALSVAKNLDDSKGVYVSSAWRPFNNTNEIFSTVPDTSLYESQVFPVKNGTNIELWQLVGGHTQNQLTFITNARFTNDVFDDGIGTKEKVPIFNGVITGLINNWTGELESYIKSAVKPNNGGPITSTDVISQCGIYRKKDNDYYVKQFNGRMDLRWFALQQYTLGFEVPINQAIKASSEIEAELFIPSGIYIINASINLLDNTSIKGESNNGINDPASTPAGASGAVIQPSAVTSFSPLAASGKTNINLTNIHFDGCSSFNLVNCSNIKMTYLKITNSTNHGMYFKSCNNLLIDNCYVDTTINGMGIFVEAEGSTTPDCQDITVTNCTVLNTQDTAIAISATNVVATHPKNIIRTNISFNIIINAGKCGIKNSIESNAANAVQFKNAVIIGNKINGWGSLFLENAITIASFKNNQYIENIVIDGNIVTSDTRAIVGQPDPVNYSYQAGYILLTRISKASIVNNVFTNGCTFNGIQILRSSDCVVTANIIDKACQYNKKDDPIIPNLTVLNGSVVLNSCLKTTFSNNIIKNTGLLSAAYPDPATNKLSGLLLYNSSYGNYTGNLIYDDRTLSTAIPPALPSTPPELDTYKVQYYGIQEAISSDSTKSSNNIFGVNISYGNLNSYGAGNQQQNFISARSQYYDGGAITATYSGTNFTLSLATALLILPVITSNKTLTLYTPTSDIIVNTSLTIYNSYPGSTYTQTLTLAVVDSYGNSITIIEPNTIYELKWTGSNWLVVNIESKARTADLQAGTNNTKYVTPAGLTDFWTYNKAQPQTISAVWTHNALVKYSTDLSAGYDARTLIDKGYADSKFTPIIEDPDLTSGTTSADLTLKYGSSPISTIVSATSINTLFLKKDTTNWISFSGALVT